MGTPSFLLATQGAKQAQRANVHFADATFPTKYTSNMVDLRASKKADQLQICPACGGRMPLSWGIYTCSCGHFDQDPLLRDNVESDDPASLRFCNCEYCLKKRNGSRL